jgi:hypothetical protein
MRIRPILPALLLGLPTAGPLAAAIRVLPDPPALKSFECYDNGLCYWGHAVSGCGGEFGTEGTLGTVAVRGPRFKEPRFQLEGFRSPLHVLARACDLPQYGVARDDAFVYYSESHGIYRLGAGAANGTSGTLIGAYRNTDFPGALMIHNGRLYFARGNNSIVGGLGRFQIAFFRLPTTNLFDPEVIVAHGGSIPNEQPGRIKKMAVRTIKKTNPISGGQFDAEVGLALGERGLLLRFDLDDFALFNSPDPIILARNVTDFAVRRDSFEEFGGTDAQKCRPGNADFISAHAKVVGDRGGDGGVGASPPSEPDGRFSSIRLSSQVWTPSQAHERQAPARLVGTVGGSRQAEARRSKSGNGRTAGDRPYDFTRRSALGFSGISLPSIRALQPAVIAPTSSKVSLGQCLWDSRFTSMPRVWSKSNWIVLLSADFITMAGRLPKTQLCVSASLLSLSKNTVTWSTVAQTVAKEVFIDLRDVR